MVTSLDAKSSLATCTDITKNNLFNSALRQSNAIRKDLTSISNTSSTPALTGTLSASLTSFSRTIDEYAALAKQEPIPEKVEKAQVRIKNFRAELSDYRDQFERVRSELAEKQLVNNRTELLGRRPHQTSTPENPYANATVAAGPQGSVFRPSAAAAAASPFGAAPNEYGREMHAMREQSFMSGTNAQLDEFLERGRAVLGDLGQQREMLKGTQKKLYSVANTLGISGDTIRMVERRAKQDKWIFWAGVVIFVIFVWLVLRYLR